MRQVKGRRSALTASLVFLFVLTVTLSAPTQAQPFTALTNDFGRTFGQSIWVDLDNDGDLDFVCTKSFYPPDSRYYTRIWRNDGNGAFTEIDAGLVGVVDAHFAAADYDNDGKIDLAVSGNELDSNGFGVYRARIYHNDGNLKFTQVFDDSNPSTVGALEFGDYDRDGDLDVLETSFFSYGTPVPLVIFANDGHGNFTRANVEADINSPLTGRWGDFNSDGELDVLFTYDVPTPDRPLVRQNINGERFQTISFNDVSLSGFYVEWADLDGDGDLDAIIQSQQGFQLYILFNDNGVFRYPPKPMIDFLARRPVFADVDNDGDIDAYLPLWDGGQGRIALNDGSGNFSFSADLFDNYRFSTDGAFGDFDGDGDLDLLITKWAEADNTPGTILYRNDSTHPNTPPKAPAGLTATQLPNGDVKLSWNASQDNETTNPKLMTYDVRIGTAAGKFDIAAPPANFTTGKRKVAAQGQERTTFRFVRDLPKGTYYWSVQGVDTGFAGSPWAAEQSFTISNTPPTIAGLSPQHVGLSQVSTASFSISDLESPASALTVRAESEDETLIPSADFSFGGSDANRTISFKPVTGKTGSTHIALIVQDPQGLSTRRTFSVTVEEFTPIPISLPYEFNGVYTSLLPPADFDGDGDLDLHLSGMRRTPGAAGWEYFSAMLVNDGHGNFTFGKDFPYQPGNITGKVADFDGDGDVDILGDGKLFLNDGTGAFVEKDDVGVIGGWPIGDINGDGKLDVVVYTYDSQNRVYTIIALWNGSGWEQVKPPLDLPGSFASASIGDFDQDGNLDILSGVSQGDNQIMNALLFPNTGRGIFGAPTALPVGIAFSPGNYWVEDYDHDGDLDVVSTLIETASYPTHSYVLANDGRGNFLSNRIDTILGPRAFDFDNDGSRDRFVYEPTPQGSAQWHLYRADGTAAPLVLGGTTWMPTQIGDFDGDGDLDFVGFLPPDPFNPNAPSGPVFFRNNSDRPNTPPSVPPALSATIDLPNDRVTFKWDRATDDHTPSPQLTYNLRVGTTPGGIQIQAPDPLIAQDGSVGIANIRNLYRLPAGTYYWSVQAIDGQYKRGPWATEQTFLLDKPAIAPVADIATPPGVQARPIVIHLTGDSISSVNDLVMSAHSEDTNLIADASIQFTGSGATRTLVFTPADHDGDTHIEILATGKNGAIGAVRFKVTVRQFEQRTLPEPRFQNSNLQFADLNGDGRLDLISVGRTPDIFELQVLKNIGGDFALQSTPLPTEFRGRVLLGDGNGDNRVDLFLSGTNGAQLWSAATDFDFVPITAPLTTPQSLLDKTDFDHDGFPDVGFWAPRNLTGVGSERFLDPTFSLWPNGTQLVNSNITAVVWSDLDGDGDLDLIISAEESPVPFVPQSWSLKVWENRSGHLVETTAEFSGAVRARIAAADLDGDGLPEVYVAPVYASEANRPKLWKNLGGFHFSPVDWDIPPQYNGVPKFGDWDNDGDPDIVMTQYISEDDIVAFSATTPVSFFRNNGNLSFEGMGYTAPLLTVHDAAWGDFDNDGDLDLAVYGDNYQYLSKLLFVNGSLRSNTPPSAPTGFAIGHVPNGVVLKWNPAEDAEGKQFLTYNLRIGTTSGASDILSPTADLNTGQRRIAGPGNGNAVPKFVINGLPNGHYFWSVQSVDAGYASSTFGPEQTFTISRPQFTGLKNYTVASTVPAGPFAFSVSDVETSPSALKLTVVSQNDALIPTGGISIVGNGTDRTFQFTPAAHRAGKAVLVFTAEDGQGEITVQEITITVAQEFSAMPTQLVPYNDGVVAWADVDGDGDLDLFTGGFFGQPFAEGAGRSEIWRNDGGIITTNILESFIDAGAGAAAFADADGDGILDLAVSGGRGATVLYFQAGRNSGSMRTLSTATRSELAWGDLNMDGRPDLLLSGSIDYNFIARNIIRIYQNNLPSSFSPLTPFDPGLRDGNAVWFDMDNDGDDDLLICGSREFNSGYARTILYRNDNGALTDVTGNIPQMNHSAVAVADFDLDGAPDILICGEHFVGNNIVTETHLLRNDGFGNFTDVPGAFPAYAYGTAAWGDYDGDGDPDLLISGIVGGEHRTDLWVNNDGQFTLSDNFFVPGVVRSAAWGDVDGDGDLDLALVGPIDGDAAFTGVFLNNFSQKSIAPPPVPIDLSVLGDGVDAIVSWRMPADAPGGLSFNIRVGSAPGAIDIVSPMADLTTGRRLIPGPGNASWSFKRRLKNLAGQQFYWSVQAIDPAFHASAFAPEQDALTPRNETPVISNVGFTTSSMNHPFGPIDFTVDDPDGTADALTITVTSLSPTLIPQGNLQLTGQGSNRSISGSPALNASGAATLRVVAIDPLGAAATNDYRVIIRAMTELPTTLPQILPSAIEPADFDHDGDIDIFIAGMQPIGDNSGTSYSGLFRNDAGAFVNVTGPAAQGDIRAAWGDKDDDGDLDFICCGIWFTNNDGLFTMAGSGSDSAAVSAWGDIDNDGDLDVVTVGGNQISAFVYQNNGGLPVSIASGIVPVKEGAIAFGDADNDGDLDLAVSGREIDSPFAIPTLRIYRNDGGVFTEVKSFIGVTQGTLQWADANNDGRVDLLMAGRGDGDERERLFLNAGGFNFIETYPGPTTGGVGSFPGAMLFDLDNDGKLDLAEFTATATFGVRLNAGGGQFLSGSKAAANTPAGLFRIADFDNDGDFDVIVGGPVRGNPVYDGSIKIFQNHWISAPPSVTKLTATVSGNDVDLKWPAMQFGPAATPPTYNLRVGRKPGGVEVVSPLSNPATGKRQVPAYGNMGFAFGTILHGLSPGVYYWSIQPIDSAWTGGPFAAEQTFTVGAASNPPSIKSAQATQFGGIQFTLQASAGSMAIIETSTDLKTWTTQSTQRVGATGSESIETPMSDTTAFYRLQILP